MIRLRCRLSCERGGLRNHVLERGSGSPTGRGGRLCRGVGRLWGWVGAQSSGPGHFLRHCRDRLRRQPGRRRGSVRWIQLAHFTSTFQRRQWPSSWFCALDSTGSFHVDFRASSMAVVVAIASDLRLRTTTNTSCYTQWSRQRPFPHDQHS